MNLKNSETQAEIKMKGGKNMRKTTKWTTGNRGITLIALVITIIVLLILARN